MEIRKSDIVEATAGREKGRFFFVLAEDGEFLLLADGKHRRLEAPKRKKRKHVRFIASSDCRVANKLRNDERFSNSELRKAIAAFGAAKDPDQEG